MFSLRPYQEKAKSDIRASFLKGHKRVILCMPTGAGKTVTFVDMVSEVLKKGKKAMILCDRKELITQALSKLNDLGLNPTVIAPGYPQHENNCYLASVDTLRRRDLKEIDFLITDEAHKQSFDKTILRYIEEFDPYVIGATATPIRTGNQKPLDNIYTSIIEPITIKELLELNFLVPARTFSVKESFTDVKMKGSDFDTSELFKKFNDTVLYDGVIENYLKFAKGKKAICFNVNVEHSRKMCEAFNEAGIVAEHIDGNTPQHERVEKLYRFKMGYTQVLCNCSILTTGYDEPTIECVIINRATMSLALYLQMCGRGSRLFENKNEFIVIDQGANVYRHGLWDEDREWSLHKKKKKKDGVTPVKLCPACGLINHASARNCIGTKEDRELNEGETVGCNYEFPIEEKKLKKAEFEEVRKKEKRGARLKPNIKDMNRKELHEYAKSKGYKSGWVHKQIELAKKV
jgi:superfamily II DNA or RNA helicase